MEIPKKVTIKEIAETANVSKATVSRVINGSTPVAENKRLAVEKAMETLKYQPNHFARTLAGGRSMTIGVVTQNIGSPFYDLISAGIIRGLGLSDYTPLIVDGRWDATVEKTVIQTLLDRRVDGLVIVGGKMSPDDLKTVGQQKPTVLIARELSDWRGRCVLADNFHGGLDATQYLIDMGHQSIAHITGIKNHQDTLRRLEGYQAALKNAGIDLDKRLVFEGDYSGRSGILAIESLLKRGVHFTAVFAGNDEMAFGARLALSRHNIRVPDDVSLIGFDDQPLTPFMTPPLTTVRQPGFDMGKAAAEAIVKRLGGEEIELSEFKTDLVVRESVARI